MRIEDTFDRERLNSKEKAYFDIVVLPDGSTVKLPLLIVHGQKAGKAILVLGAVHGEVGRMTRETAEIFGAPVVWEHPEVPPGRTLSVAVEKGIPALYTESSGGGWLSKEIVLFYKDGVLNIMKYLGMLPAKLAACRWK